jgi:hypothetical protein
MLDKVLKELKLVIDNISNWTQEDRLYVIYR